MEHVARALELYNRAPLDGTLAIVPDVDLDDAIFAAERYGTPIPGATP